MNIWKGIFGHKIRFFNSASGSYVRDRTGMRPRGMTARQWKKSRHKGREAWGPRRGAVTAAGQDKLVAQARA